MVTTFTLTFYIAQNSAYLNRQNDDPNQGAKKVNSTGPNIVSKRTDNSRDPANYRLDNRSLNNKSRNPILDINKNQVPAYRDPPAIKLQDNALGNDQFQVHYNKSNINNAGVAYPNGYVDKDEVIYAKPSFEQGPKNMQYPERGLSLQSLSAASSLNRDQNSKMESMQTSEALAKSSSPITINRYYKNRANAVYQNEPQNHLISNNPSTHSLSRQGSAFSSHASQKDTLV